ncbi:MAG TPA: serine hydrolase domain-containing protein [Longimicrobium sp.]|nr:serine hydrolase domain-containing protein [Longimicrobium sp.]
MVHRTITRATLLLLAVAPAAAWAQPGSDAVVVRTAEGARADSVLTVLEAQGFSGVALIARDGEVILQKGYGMANRAAGTRMSPSTLVQIGSNTKDFTIVALRQLELAGKLRLDDPITRYFPNVPADKQGITLEMLMRHRAGFDRHLGGDFEPIGRDEMVARALRARLLFAPGDSTSYSNIGYSLLAAVIEQVSEKSYDQYVRDHITGPLGLRETGFTGLDPARVAHGYNGDRDVGGILDRPHAPDGPYWNLRGNGGMVSTVGEMHRFYQALFTTERLLPAPVRDLHFNQRAGAMLAGSDMVSFFLYNRVPGTGYEIILATNSAQMRGPRVRQALAQALGLPQPGGPGVQVETTDAGPRPAAGAGPRATTTAQEGLELPPTPAAAAARRYLGAFNSGDPEQMRAFLREHATTNPERSLDERVQGYRSIYEQTGFLRPLRVDASSETQLTLHVRSAVQGELQLIFTVEPRPPHRLVSVQIEAGDR